MYSVAKFCKMTIPMNKEVFVKTKTSINYVSHICQE